MREKRGEITDKLIHFYDNLSEGEIKLFTILFFTSPLILIVLLNLAGIHYVTKFILVVLWISILALIYAAHILIWIMKRETGTPEMNAIANSINEGAEGFFRAQYGTIFKLSFVFAVAIMVLYYTKQTENDPISQIISNSWMALFSGMSFMFGAFASASSGYAGMWVSVRSNIRVASAARRCYNEAIEIAFKGGYFSAIINIALALLGICSMFLLFLGYISVGSDDYYNQPIEKIPLLMIGFGFGASFVAMFAQLGGGIYTKAADVGADLIGKVEAGIPEDDYRNPAVIADLVGDNVGDCAGQCADLFESITAEILSAMILGASLAQEAGFSVNEKVSFMLFPLTVHCLDIFVSTIGMYFVKTKPGLPDYNPSYGAVEDPLDIMKKGYRVSMVLGITGFFAICRFYLHADESEKYGIWINYALCGLVGICVSYLFIEITQYYTDYNYGPVKRIVYASKTGPATNIIAGLSVGMESTGLPIIVISVAILLAYYLGDSTGIVNAHGERIGGLFGTAIATMGMFCTGVFVLSMSGFGPIADNAGGIVEMSHQAPSVRQITDRLDAVGNVTKANAKGYSVGSASLACFLLFSAFIDEVNFISPIKLKVIDITMPEVFVGGMLGSMVVFVFSSWAIAAVGNAAQDVIKEVRRQFRENPGILEGSVQPNYKQCVEIVARAGLREMIRPGLLALLAPMVVGYTFKILGYYQEKELLGAKVISAFLMFATSTGILMALFLNNAGGAWDNAKKYVETGAVGGKGSDVHKAAVTGDTVGDPCKDTAGPSIHILIKLLSTITLVLCPLFI
jgi:H(+)-translocating pyrophosphatase